jgi:surface antigen
MTLDEFLNKWRGVYCDFDNKYKNQCKDIFSYYNRDVVGNPTYIYGDAWQLYDNAPDKYYTKVLNTPTGVPPRGAVLIWKKEYGGYGHVGIVEQADTRGLLVFSQNYTGNLDLPQSTSYSYNKVLGWLIPKGGEMIDQNYVNGELYKTDSGMVLWHIPNPDVANKYFHDWGTQKPITDIVPVKEVIKEVPVEKIVEKPVEVIKEVPVEKIVEVEVPKEIITEVIKQVKVETPLPEDEQRVLEIYRKIKSYFERNKK